jgi:putative nucleotidyltransferase with HDIG domain
VIYTNIETFDVENVRIQFREDKAYTCTLPFITRDSEIFLSKILKTVLDEVNQGALHSYLEYTLNELSMNASKANSKRLFFLSRGQDINNRKHYEAGIPDFKDEVFRDFSAYEQLHRENDSYVRITLRTDGKSLYMEIVNNSTLIEEEKQRISQRLKAARKFNNLTEVLSHGFDGTEGAGFGLIVIILMLRKLNLDEKALVYKNEGDQCISSLTIPLGLLSKDHGKVIAEEIADEIAQMPQFPESITSLQKELSDPASSFVTIADTISSDPSLAAEIMRIANSPVYRVRNKITDISGAVRIIGMLGVKSVLYNYGVNKLFKKKYDRKLIQEINDHSFYVALIASFLGRYKKLGRLNEDIYAAALLHDMGKIIVKSLHNELENKLRKLCIEKHIPISILEDLSEGYNHSLIGSEVAGKWDFPEKFIDTIANHHTPLEAPEESKVLTFAVYLANEVFYYIRRRREFNEINIMVLKFFGMEDEKSFKQFIESLKEEGLGQ